MYRSYYHSVTRTEPVRRRPHTFSLFNVNVERHPIYTIYRENEPLLHYIENLFVLPADREIEDYLPHIKARSRCRCRTEPPPGRRRRERSEETAERGRSRVRIEDIHKSVEREELSYKTRRRMEARPEALERGRERYPDGREGRELTQRR